jgi:hypothetical protein
MLMLMLRKVSKNRLRKVHQHHHVDISCCCTRRVTGHPIPVAIPAIFLQVLLDSNPTRRKVTNKKPAQGGSANTGVFPRALVPSTAKRARYCVRRPPAPGPEQIRAHQPRRRNHRLVIRERSTINYILYINKLGRKGFCTCTNLRGVGCLYIIE